MASVNAWGSISCNGEGTFVSLPEDLPEDCPSEPLVRTESLLEFVEFRRDSLLTRSGIKTLKIVDPRSFTDDARRD